MTVIDIEPLILRNVELTIGKDDFAKNVSQVTFTPSTSEISWTGLALNTYSETGTAVWKCTLTYAQDWGNAESLSRFLFNHEGEKVEATFRPVKNTGPSFKARLVITPGAIGGNVNAVATASVTLGCLEKPELIPAGTPNPSATV